MKFEHLLLTAIITISSCIILCIHVVAKQPHKVALEEPPVIQLFIDDKGNKTDTPPEDKDPNIEPEVTYITQEIQGDQDTPTTTFSVATEEHVKHRHSDTKCEHLIFMSDAEAWQLLTGGRFAQYPMQKFGQIKPIMQSMYAEKRTTITVPIWYWENPNDDTDFTKTTQFKEWVVNEEIADLCKEVFQDIYEDPSQPVINIADKGMGTWAVRGKMHSDNRTVSAHALGASFDINPGTGTYNVNGTLYGNGYNNQPMPVEIWEQLPESHKKYHVLYIDSPIVQAFKRHGFYWGGDWKNSKDCMHLAFLGDGVNAREVGQDNFMRYN